MISGSGPFRKSRRTNLCLYVLIALLTVVCLQVMRLNEFSQRRRDRQRKDEEENRSAHQPLKTEEAKHIVLTSSQQPTAPVDLPQTTSRAPTQPLLQPQTNHFSIADIPVNISSVCPLPVLHPLKFEKLMQWGTRKTFSPCQAIPNTNTDSFATLTESNGDASASVAIDATLCPQGGWLLSFEELMDDQLPRLQSVMDAELRQNELRERYAEDPSFSFAKRRQTLGNSQPWAVDGVMEPYILLLCGPLEAPIGKELFIRALPLASRRSRVEEKRKRRLAEQQGDNARRGIRNVMHVMFDSTSLYAFRRSAKQTMRWLEDMDGRTSRVYTFKHLHSVSCCSPGNQIPMYSGNMNGEGDRFVQSEPHQHSRDWLWNIADSLGYTTFWSLDNCPDKSARDYHATPSVDIRVVAPLCLAGVLLSHKERECLAGRTIDQHVFAGLESFWKHHENDKKFAAVQFITPHEETEKQILELDIEMERFLRRMDDLGVWNTTALIFWSDHGINFGKYASTHDGEIEKLFPFAHVMLPRQWVEAEGEGWHKRMRTNEERLVSPYDMYELTRSLLYLPEVQPPSFSHDPRNPPLPRPFESHIMASFQKPITPMNPLLAEVPYDRDCMDANIPVEFCTCIPWKAMESNNADMYSLALFLLTVVEREHRRLVSNVTTASGMQSKVCTPLGSVSLLGVEWQTWPTEYRPKEQVNSKRMWAMPSRDMIRLHYTHVATGAIFEGLISVDKKQPRKVYDIARIDRVDAMKGKCGVVDKVSEQLCECLQYV